MHRRLFLATVLSAAALAAAPGSAQSAPQVSVAKTPTCGCCTAWVEHMQEAGFEVETTDMTMTGLVARKTELGVDPRLASCHTATVGGYVIEGHVPAADVRRLLAERPEAIGLAVPGMPVGSPGMEYGDRRDPYDTLLLLRDGGTRVFESHR